MRNFTHSWMERTNWQGYPTHSDKSGWHWLKLKSGFTPVPLFWDAIQQSWRNQSHFISHVQVALIHEYMEPITWAIVYEPHNNTTVII